MHPARLPAVPRAAARLSTPTSAVSRERPPTTPAPLGLLAEFRLALKKRSFIDHFALLADEGQEKHFIRTGSI
jgi:hypothetical protein